MASTTADTEPRPADPAVDRACAPVRTANAVYVAPVEALRAVSERRGGAPLGRHGYDEGRSAWMPSSRLIERAVGSWPLACAVAGVAYDRRGRTPAPGTHESAIEDLRSCAADLGVRLRATDYTGWAAEHDAVSYYAVLRLFGTWEAATHAAGVVASRPRRIDPGSEAQRARVRETLAAVRADGRSPTMDRFDAARVPGTPIAHRLARHHGSWARALAAYDGD